MNNFKLITALLSFLAFAGSCTYQKGSLYKLKSGNDTLTYVLAAKGKGSRISSRAFEIKLNHDLKGDSCQIIYLSDSISINDKKAILLFNSYAPEIKKDFLTKGFFGTLSSKQIVSYLVVSYDDMDKFIVKVD